MAAALYLIIINVAICSLASGSIFKPRDGHSRHFFKKLTGAKEDTQHSGDGHFELKPEGRADLVQNVEELKALIHNFMVKFDEHNIPAPKDDAEMVRKALNNMILTLITQSYVHVFKPDLMRNNLAKAVTDAGMDISQQHTTDDQREAFISELAAEIKALPISLVNDFILKYIAVDDDDELVLKTMIKRRGDDGGEEIQKLKGEVQFSRIIQEMILQSYMIDFNVAAVDGKVTIASADGARTRVFDAPPLDTLTKVKLLETRASYELNPLLSLQFANIGGADDINGSLFPEQ